MDSVVGCRNRRVLGRNLWRLPARPVDHHVEIQTVEPFNESAPPPAYPCSIRKRLAKAVHQFDDARTFHGRGATPLRPYNEDAMSRQSKLSRNDPCPCLSGEKFKRCCSGKINWETIIQQGSDRRPYLSVRGRNLLFVARIAEALQFTSIGKALSLKDYKAAFTAEAVRKIHEAIRDLWPPNIDIVAALKRQPHDVSGLSGELLRGLILPLIALRE